MIQERVMVGPANQQTAEVGRRWFLSHMALCRRASWVDEDVVGRSDGCMQVAHAGGIHLLVVRSRRSRAIRPSSDRRAARAARRRTSRNVHGFLRKQADRHWEG